MKSVPKVIGVAAFLAAVVGAGYVLYKYVAACYRELDLEDDEDYVY